MTARSSTISSTMSRIRIAVLYMVITATSLMGVTALTSIVSNSDDDLALAQTQEGNNPTTNTNATTIDTFRAKGEVSSLASDTLAGRPSSNTSEIWVLGGDWEFGVGKGNLTNLAALTTMSSFDLKQPI